MYSALRKRRHLALQSAILKILSWVHYDSSAYFIYSLFHIQFIITNDHSLASLLLFGYNSCYDINGSVIGVWIDTYVFYQSVLQKRPEFGHCVSQRRNVITLWRNITSWRHVHGDGCLQTPVVYDYPFIFYMFVPIPAPAFLRGQNF